MVGARVGVIFFVESTYTDTFLFGENESTENSGRSKIACMYIHCSTSCSTSQSEHIYRYTFYDGNQIQLPLPACIC